jgi:dihydrofolate synthase/folylpolyglutamate synthase
LSIAKLSDFLDVKPLYYDEIDYTRMPRVYKKIQASLTQAKVIHLIGTNGKGTTGRFLATALLKKAYSVGHYTSPHILKFNERIWLDGVEVSDDILENAHRKLLGLLSQEDAASLSYFEYTTLLAMIVYEKCDYIVLEAGLGGEHDATAVFAKILTLFTPIDFDHTAFLGNTVESIATTKLNAMSQNAIVGLQKHKEVYAIAQEIALKKGASLTFLKESDEPFFMKVVAISQVMQLPKYLEENLVLAALALVKLGFDFTYEDFKDARLFGRLTKIAPNIIVDVGHNVLAARAIVQALQGQKFTLIYNSYKDKDFKEILTILKPIIESVEIIDVQDARIVSKEFLEEAVVKIGLTCEVPFGCKAYTGTQTEKNYLVFGSFSVAETFLKQWQNS